MAKALRLGTLIGKYFQSRVKAEIACRNNADRLQGPWRDSVVQHWKEHAEEHRSMIYDLSMKMITTLGMDPKVDFVTMAPDNPAFESLLGDLESRSRELLDIGRQILELDIGVELRVLIENQILTDSQHLSDAIRMRPTGTPIET